MKVIDLLNKIAKGEEVPKEIKIENDELYFNKYKNTYVFEDGENLNWCYYVTDKSLTDEIEIIEEEKEIEKLNLDTDELRGKEIVRSIDYLLEGKINQLIDLINDMRDKE